MKKLIFILTALIVGFTASAQFTTGVLIKQVTNDSIKTGALTVTKTQAFAAGYSVIAIQAVVTKVSGTPAGSGKLYGTVDGTNWVQVGTDTLAIANTTTSTKIWTITNSPYAQLKVVYTGIGTMKATSKTWYIARKHFTE